MRRWLLGFAFTVLASPAWGAITYDNASGGTKAGGAGTQLTFAHVSTGTATTGLLLVFCGLNTGGGTDVSSMTYAGAAMTSLSNTLNSSTWRLTVYYKRLPATGNNNVVVNLTIDVALACSSITLTGVDQATTFGTVATNGGTGDPITATATTASGQLLVDGPVVPNSGVTLTAGANQTQRGSQQTVTGMVSVISTQAGVDGGVMSWTGSAGQNWGQAAVPVLPASTHRAILPMLLK